MLSLYAAVAERSFRRYSTYTGATLAGIFTNSVFGLIYSFAYKALWEQAPDAGGYDKIDAVTFVWLGQALLMTVALWGGGTTDDLAERIKTGDVAIDLYRPTGLVGWYLAGDLGRAAYHLVTRGLGPTFIGLIFFHIRLPSSPLDAAAFAVSLVLAVVVSFGLRFIVSSSAFWLLDASGARFLSGAFAIFFSGMMLPLVLFPGWLGDARPGVAVVGDDPGAQRHLARPVRRVVAARRARLPGALGAAAARGLRGRAARGDPQGGGAGWLRPRPHASGAQDLRDAGATPTSRGSGCARRWPTPRRSC